jgi:hypothetical protein
VCARCYDLENCVVTSLKGKQWGEQGAGWNSNKRLVQTIHPEEFKKTMSERITRHRSRSLPSPFDIARFVANVSENRMVKDALSA